VLRPQYRAIGYLHRGSRVRGLIREESDYLVSPKGKPYGISDESLSQLKQLLGAEYTLPDNISLQILTHKSFAHGRKPFNEKLAVLGSHFLKYKSAIFTMNTQGLNHIGTQASKNLISNQTLAQFAVNHDLGDYIFWKKRDITVKDPQKSGQWSVYARTSEAIIGAVLLQHGKEKASKFVDEVLLNGENSLLKASQGEAQ
jgi:large subunit ribosomal protein L15